MRKFTLKRWLWAAGSLVLLIPCAASAAGLGRLTILSALGHPLSAEVELVSAQKGETITAKLASIDTYQQANLPFNAALVGTRVTVERRANGQAYLKVTTQRPVYEPFAELLIELNSENGKVTRQYTVLLDPPGYGRAAAELPPPLVAAPTVRTAPPAQETRAAPSAPDTRGPVSTQTARAPSPAQESPAPAAAAPVAPAEPGAPGPAAAVRAVPGAKPAVRPAEPVVAGASGPKQYGPVKRGETLGRIASIVKPDGVTLEQTLVGLYRQNPDAFIKKNMNLVKSGRILKVPEANEMSALPQREAVKEVRLQVADFNAFRGRLAERAADAPEDGSVTSGRIGSARVAERDAGGPRDTVKLSRGDAAAKGAGKGGGADRVRALEEEAVAREKSLADANERIAQLEKTIKDMQRLAEMKSSTATAQSKPGDKPGPATQAAPAAKDQPPVVAIAPVVPPPPAVKAPDSSPVVPPATSPAPPAASPDMGPGAPKAEAPPAERAPPAAQAKPAAPEPDFIDTVMDDPLYLAAAGGAVVVLGGLALVAARRRRGGDDSLVKISPTLSGGSSGPGSAAPSTAAALDAGPAASFATKPSTGPAPAPSSPRIPLDPDRTVARPSVATVKPAAKPSAAPAVAPAVGAAAAPAKDDNDLDFDARRRPIAPASPSPAASTGSARQIETGARASGVRPPDELPAAAARPQAPVPPPPPKDSFSSVDPVSKSRGESSLPDFSLDIPTAGPAAPNATRQTAASDFNLDFNLEPLPPIDTPAESRMSAAPATEPPPAPAPDAAAPDLDFKLDGLNLNFGNDAAAGAPSVTGKDDHWYDVQQKFDLAKAYEEMGDKNGAREILQEVVKEGDADQQAQAKTLLGSLG